MAPVDPLTTDPVIQRCERIKREIEQQQRDERAAWHRQSTDDKARDACEWIEKFLANESEDRHSLTYGDVWKLEDIAILIRHMARGEFICTKCHLRKDAEPDDGIAF